MFYAIIVTVFALFCFSGIYVILKVSNNSCALEMNVL